jgi:DNA-binding Xre family transcriptional regulator
MNNNMNKSKHRGSDLRDFLREEGVLEEVEVRAVKRALAMKLAALASEQSVTKSEMAAHMKTSRAAVNRLLDADNPSITLTTLDKAARALGRKVKIKLVPG